MNRVLIYRNEILPASETFIAAQAVALRRYRPSFTGLKRVSPSLPLDEAHLVLLAHNNGLKDKFLRRLFLRTGYAPGFYRRLRDLDPALLHAHFAVDACAALPLAQKLRISLIVTLHGYDVLRSDDALQSSAYGRTYLRRRDRLWQQASLFLCVSEHIRQAALERGYPAEKLSVHHIGVDLKAFHPEPSIVREPIVLFIGRLVEKKGCIHLLRAMANVLARLPQAQLVILGDGPLRFPLEAASRSELPAAKFLGTRSPAEVRDWMRRASLLAAPSIVASDGDAEGLPTVLCEAQAMGLPVVAFSGPGTTEAVIDRETALLVPPADDNALGNAILTVLNDPLLQSRLGAAGRRRAEQCFDLEKQTALLEEKYDAVLGQQ